MAPRPSWQGHLKLSLVTCPVALYTATSTGGDVHFNLINPKTNNRIKMITTDPDTGPISRSDLVKGYEVSKGEYVLLTDEEIKSVKLESNKTIDIESFVPAKDIDRIYWDNPYFLAPDGKIGQDAFNVIRTAMEKSGKIALARVVMSTRERLLALEPRGKGILAYTLRTDDEVRQPDEVFGGISTAKADADMIKIAEKIIEQKAGPFDPSKFNDRYEEALKALIADKQKGKKPAKIAAPKEDNVVDLMAALRASLNAKAGRAASKPASKPSTKAASKASKPRTRKAG
ncbi:MULTISPECIES: Ku protein [unclassified Brevundimonas]|uniref:non-homologous end joining protein Ku n=1 Tax=unclassified Brevundimonas TaxID=2622653 RepID=UPI0025BE5A6D|nr:MULTISPECIES: Ku protein [unclassified Brevundimonas]